MDKQQIALRADARPGGSSFEAVTAELSEAQLSDVSGGKGGTKASQPVKYLEIKLVDVIITSVSF